MPQSCPKCHSDSPDDTDYCGKCGAPLHASQEAPASQAETLWAPLNELTAGSIFAGRYQIIEELGHGGMGRVYKVIDTKVNEKIALKLVKPEIASDKGTLERFNNELRLARTISQKNVCRMYDMGEAGGSRFITMEYVQGEDLKSMIEMSGSLSLGMLLNVGKQVCDGLAEAHGLGVVHRDLKPQNIMIDKHGNAKIMDFGIARSVREKGLTGPSVMIGTPEYMSPEQAEARIADHRSDIYSLGVILYEMATSRVPFTGDTALGVAMKHKGEAPKDPRQLNPNIPDDLGAVILRCLEKDAEKRYGNVADLKADLERVEQGLPTLDRVVPRRSSRITKDITVKLNVKRVLSTAMIVIGLAAAGLLIWRLAPRRDAGTAALKSRSIAILPFEDLSAERDQEPLADGISETLINALSRVEGLRVAARTSSFFFKGKEQDVHEIGRKLGVGTLLEGSVQVSARKLRIMVRLIDAVNGFPIWAQDYHKTVDDIFGIQDDISESVVRALKIELMGERRDPRAPARTTDREAYNLYLRGRYFWEKREKGDLEKAIGFFNQAIGKDPSYALAYAGIADCYVILGDNQYIPVDDAFPKAKAASLKALEIDDEIAEAHASLASLLESYEHDFSGAEKEFLLAIQRNPGYATARHWYALFLSCQGRHEEAIAEMERARELDPLSPRLNANLGLVLYYASRYDRAISELERSIELFPEHGANYEYITRAFALAGRYEEAMTAVHRLLELVADPSAAITGPALINVLSGRRAEAQKGLAKAMAYAQENFTSAIAIAEILAGLGEKDQALGWLDKALAANESTLAHLKVNPLFDAVRSDPRFKALLRKIGFDEEI
jgi:serine/threonine-protein kinase